jgi:hypothetical protein
MIRRLPNVLAALSLLLCLAAVGVALRGSYSGGATFGPQNQRLSLRFTWRDGRLFAYYCPGYAPRFDVDGPAASFGGVYCARGRSPGGLPIVVAGTSQAHVWGAGLLLGAVPALAACRRLRDARRRRRPGSCLDCGYDLTGNQSGVCPECGRPAGNIEQRETGGTSQAGAASARP